MIAPRSLEYLYLQDKPIGPDHYLLKPDNSYPDSVFTEPPSTVFYIHVFESAVITESGDVISKNVKVAPYFCIKISPVPPENFEEAPIKREVFVITEFWGGGVFHKMLENRPRIAPYLKFLQKNKEIFVHVKENGGKTAEILKILGIAKERLVSGVLRAHVVYLPQGMPFGKTVPQYAQLLAHKIRASLGLRQSQNRTKNESNLVLIKRSLLRKFREADAIEDKMRAVAKDINLTFELFSDKALPSLPKTIDMVYHAALIVAPHGAGLSNMLFSQPGTLVVEGVCNPPYVNLCFLWTAHVLGHRYHGVPSRGGCKKHVDVSAQTMDSVVRELLGLLYRT